MASAIDHDRALGAPPAVQARLAAPIAVATRTLTAGTRTWHSAYVRRLYVTDLLILVAVVTVSLCVPLWLAGGVAQGPSVTAYATFGTVIAVAWFGALRIYRTHDHRTVGLGVDEYRLVVRATLMLFGVLAVVSVMFRWEISRGFVALAAPLGILSLLLGRRWWRVWLVHQRASGRLISPVLVIGGIHAAHEMTRWLERNPAAGLEITCVWVPDRRDTGSEWLDAADPGVPVIGTDHSLEKALAISGAQVIIVTGAEHLGHQGLKDLTWQLLGREIELLVSPHVVDVATTRVHLRAVSNTPFLHLDEPRFEGASRLGKAIFDKVVAASALVLLAPVLVLAAAAVKLSGPGPILYRSERIGVGGQPFEMLKFRSMVAGADQQLAKLAGPGPLFKLQNDPRVTRIGRILRRYSIDELPQLFNVLRGDMSIVGPRPPLRYEVENYDGHVRRRLLVKQGITGLWQVSGRSDLDWEESVRLDLDYVENWSLVRDLQIVWQTVRAVVKPHGAY